MATLALAACGSGGSMPTLEVNSGAPPGVANLKGLLERQIRRENDVSSVDCRKAPKPVVGLGGLIWDCRITTAPTGKQLEIEILGSVSSGRYELLECRTSPDQPYRQAPHGICRDIH